MTRTKANHRNKGSVREGTTSGIWIYLALLAAVFVAYGQTISHEFLNYDDPIFVAEPHIRAGLTLSGITWAFKSGYTENSFPLTWISHMLDSQLFGMSSGPHHLVNVVLHATATTVLFAFLKRATGATGRSAFVAFAFGLHPLHVESVAWIAERKDVLCGLFWMLTLWTYARYVERPSIGRYVFTAAMFCCGLLSKPMMVSFPFIALLLDWWPFERFQKRPVSALLIEKVPLIALSLCASVMTYVTHQHQGDVVAVAQIPMLARIGNAFVSYIAYLKDFVWPSNLAVFYPYLERPVWLTLLAALAVVAATVIAARSIRRRPYFSVGWFWYLGALIPTIGLIQAGSQARADRYTYIPSIGLSIVAAWGAAELFEKRHWNHRTLTAAAVGVCTAWTAVTWVEMQYWRDSVTLFTHALEVTDANYVAYHNLGVALREEGKIQEAVSDFERAVAILPEDAQLQDSLGEALTDEGRIDEGTPHLLEAVRLRPDYAKAHIDLGTALLGQDRKAEAESQYRIAVQLQPENAAAQYGLGGVLMSEGREQEARIHLEQALPLLTAQVDMNPQGVDGHYNLGTLYGILGRTDEAIVEFSQVIRMRPGDAQARFNLGTALATENRWNEAAEQFAAATQLVPDYAAAHFSLGQVQAALGHEREAEREYQEAIRLNPGLAEAHTTHRTAHVP